MASLIQQRMALERRWLWGLWALILGGVMFAIGVMLLVLDITRPSSWMTCLVFLAWAIVGAVELPLALRRLRAFEAEHGIGAGRRD